MKINLLAAVAALLLCGSTASAEQQYYSASTNYNQRIATLEAEMANMRSQLMNQGYGGAADCNAVDNDCCDFGCDPQVSWIAGAGFYYIKPMWETNPAFLASSLVGGGIVQNQQDFDYDHEFAPRVWLGMTGVNGGGGRLHWWGINSNSSASITNPGGMAIVSANPLGRNLVTGAGDVATFTSAIDLDAIDLEAIQAFGSNGWSGLVTGGVRWAQFRQNYQAQTVSIAAAVSRIDSTHSFDGFGPTGSVELRRRLWDTGFSLYGMGRGAILFGNGDQQVVQSFAGITQFTASTSQWDVLPIAELEFGGEYNWFTEFGNLFVNTSLVGMSWFGAGNSANVESIYTGGADNTSNLGFFGLTATAGVRY